ncbi:MAG: hypothetical protein LBL61_02415 [Elusimicrobiota bacterium]|nr:hypothetical protein [Elusimicrobiota bacterium]
MNFQWNNMLKIAVFILLVFITLPLLFPRADIDIDDGSAPQVQAAAARESSVKAAAAGMTDRISDFYGFDKFSSKLVAAKGSVVASSAPSAKNADIPSGEPPYEKLRLAAEAVLASSEKREQEIGAVLRTSTLAVPAAQESGLRVAFEAGIAADERAKIPAYLSEKGTLRLNGKNYDFLRSYGKEWAITENGPVALADFFARGAVYTGKNPVLTPLPESLQNPAQPDLYAAAGGADYGAAVAGIRTKTSGGGSYTSGGMGGLRGAMTADLRGTSFAGAQYGGVKTYAARDSAAKNTVAAKSSAGSAINNTAANNAALRPSQPLLAANENYMKRNYYEPQEKADAASAQAGGARSLANIRMPAPVLGNNYNVELKNVEITKSAPTDGKNEGYDEE